MKCKHNYDFQMYFYSCIPSVSRQLFSDDLAFTCQAFSMINKLNLEIKYVEEIETYQPG